MNLQDIESFVSKLPANEFWKLSDWFEEKKAEKWDAEMAQDALSGKLDHLIAQAKSEYHAGRSKPL
jgi:hypothetical protein